MEDRVDVPRLPRSHRWPISRAHLVRVLMLAMMLVGVLVARKNCATSVATFVTAVDDRAAAPVDAAPAPGHLIRLDPSMSEAQIKAAVEEARRSAANK